MFIVLCAGCDSRFEVDGSIPLCCYKCKSLDISWHEAQLVDVTYKCGHKHKKVELLHPNHEIERRLIYWGGKDCFRCYTDKVFDT